MKNLDPARAKWIRRRMGAVCGLMGLTCGMLVTGAYRVQVEDHADWRDLAEAQRQRRMHVAPKRGTIHDRNGVALAASVEVPSVSSDAHEMFRGVEDRAFPARLREVSTLVARALSLEVAEVEAKLKPRRRFVWLKRRVSAEEVQRVRDLGDPRKTANPVRGLQVEGEGKRYYPNRELLAPLLGFVAPDGEGKEGLELAMEDELRGHVEEVKGLRDRTGRLLFAEGVPNEKALQGHSIYLSIDQGIQYFAEQELDTAIRTFEALGGSIVVVDPATGDILALASGPGYNPNDYGASAPENRRNRAILDRFEPGSTMKIFTVSAALAAGSLTPTQKVYCEKGNWAVDNVVIHDTHVSEWLVPTQILAVSSNICSAKIGIELGERKLYEALRRFGFGEPTGVPLPGEATGVLRSRGRPWVQVETAAASFGQGVSVTSLQLAMATAAVANGGKLMEPILVRRVTDGAGNVVREAAPKVRREVIPAHVAKAMSEMLVAVTEGEGTGVEAALTGFKVAGKTATAQKADPESGRYTQDRFTSSFMGFVPADKPRLVIVVVLDEPMVTHAGGSVAAPAFRRVAEFSLRYLGLKPAGTKETPLSEVAQAAEPLASAKPAGSGAPWKTKAPEAVAVLPADVPPPPTATGTSIVPTLVGLSSREALRAVVRYGLVPDLRGHGVAARQEPAPGKVVPLGTSVQIFFEPPT